RILEISENDRAARAGRCAGGHDVSVAYRTPLELGLLFAAPDPLDTERALLRHAAPAHGHIRIESQAVPRPVWSVEEVEATDVIGAVVLAVASPHTARVHLRVEPFFRVVGRVRRADRFTRSFLALLTAERQERDFGAGVGLLHERLNGQPAHVAP